MGKKPILQRGMFKNARYFVGINPYALGWIFGHLPAEIGVLFHI
jgi:hypothetical protein